MDEETLALIITVCKLLKGEDLQPAEVERAYRKAKDRVARNRQTQVKRRESKVEPG